MAVVDPIKVEGLRELQRALKDADGESQKQLRLVFNEAADLVAGRARALVPRKSGRARGSVKARSGQREAKVVGGGGRVLYFGWIEFGGGRRGRGGGLARRPFLVDGRYIYRSYARLRPQLTPMLEEGLSDLIKAAGLEED